MSVGTVRTTSFEQQYICALMSDMWVCFQQSNQQLAPQSKPCRTYLITFKHIFKSSTEPSACIRNFEIEVAKMYIPAFILRLNSPCWHPIPGFEALLSIASRTGWIHPYSSPGDGVCGNQADSNTKFKVELGIPIIETSNHYIFYQYVSFYKSFI